MKSLNQGYPLGQSSIAKRIGIDAKIELYNINKFINLIFK